MLASKEIMAFKSYQNQANSFVKDYILADSLIPYTSVVGGILACKMIYDLTQLIGTNYFKIYSSFSRIQRIEWNNRAISTVHSIFITTMSLYLVFCSNLFSDSHSSELITVRNSSLSTFALGVSVGYFVADLAMIFWFFPSLGGYEYVVHHMLSLVAVAYSMLSGEGQLYTYMVLISETTTPGINLRWYLDVAGMKRSKAYLINGVVIFLAWLVARILLFIYMFYHAYLHFDQVEGAANEDGRTPSIWDTFTHAGFEVKVIISDDYIKRDSGLIYREFGSTISTFSFRQISYHKGCRFTFAY